VTAPTPEKPAAAHPARRGLVKKLLILVAIAATAAWIVGLVRLLAPLV
jgi:hypothetical protein